MNKKILVTGGAGFIAHHFIKEVLSKTDWEVISLDRLDFSGNLNRLQEVVSLFPSKDQKRVKIIYHDLKAELNPEISSSIGKVDFIVHLAAASHVDRSITNPLDFVYDNVVGTANILNFARSLDALERFIYFSTDEVFGPAKKGIFFKENDRYNSTNPYSASKAGAEELVVAFQNTYGLPSYITHTMNVFGERQSPEKYIPMVIQKVRDNQKVFVHSDSLKKIAGSRHYIHAQDVSDALLFLMNFSYDKIQLMENDINCHKFNIVGKDEIDNLSLAQFVAKIQGKELKYEMVDFHSSRPGHDLRYALDGDKMKQMGWMPQSAFDRLESVVCWSLRNPQWLSI